MTLKEAIYLRESIRNYQENSLDDQDYLPIETYLQALNLPRGLHFALAKDVPRAFNQFKKSYGFFKGVQDAIVVYGKKNDPLLLEKSGYFGFEVSLHLITIGIDHCFVGGTYDQKSIHLDLPNDQEIYYLFSIGKRKEKELIRGEFIRKILKRHQRPTSYFIETSDSLPSWIEEGLAAMVYSPSATNRQGIILTYKNNELRIYNKKPGAYDLVDLGIAKRLFEIATGKGTFEDGDHALFQINEEDEV